MPQSEGLLSYVFAIVIFSEIQIRGKTQLTFIFTILYRGSAELDRKRESRATSGDSGRTLAALKYRAQVKTYKYACNNHTIPLAYLGHVISKI